MSFKSDIEGTIDEMEIQLRHEDGSLPSFIWKNATVPCVPSLLDAGNEISIGGKFEKVAFTLHVRRVQFLTADSTIVTVDSELITADNLTPTPVVGKTIVFRGKTRRILSASEDASKAYFKLQIGGANL